MFRFLSAPIELIMKKTLQPSSNHSSTTGIYPVYHEGAASNNITVGNSIPRAARNLTDDLTEEEIVLAWISLKERQIEELTFEKKVINLTLTDGDIPKSVKVISFFKNLELTKAARKVLLSGLSSIERLSFEALSHGSEVKIEDCPSLRELSIKTKPHSSHYSYCNTTHFSLTLKNLESLTILSIAAFINPERVTLSFQGLTCLKELSIYHLHEDSLLSLKECSSLEMVTFYMLNFCSYPLYLLEGIPNLKRVCIRKIQNSRAHGYPLEKLKTIEELEIPELLYFKLEDLPELRVLKTSMVYTTDLSMLGKLSKLTTLIIGNYPDEGVLEKLPKNLTKLIILKVDYNLIRGKFPIRIPKNLPQSLKEMHFGEIRAKLEIPLCSHVQFTWDKITDEGCVKYYLILDLLHGARAFLHTTKDTGTYL